MQELTTEITRKCNSDDLLIDIVLVVADDLRDTITDAIQELYTEQYYGVLYVNNAARICEPDGWNGLHDKLSGRDFYERFDEIFDPENVIFDLENGLKNVTREVNNLVGNEDTRAVNAARQQAGIDAESEADVLATKTWDATLDERTRDTHWLLHGTTVGIDDWFQTVNGRTQYPGGFGIPEEDINCRCRLIIQLHGEYPEHIASTYKKWLETA